MMMMTPFVAVGSCRFFLSARRFVLIFIRTYIYLAGNIELDLT